ncbi:MAG: phosphate/phosphite/phosphonate ABC transporter substrate-binding protein [Betaproteobacteria bacterium]|nr:phosphate/phosphite/phosphonate ABC transporter substrate-binding protein [Betaproteobacteria bacterium]
MKRALILLLCLLPALAAAVETYTLAVVPQFSPVDIGQRWTPLLTRLEKETGLRFQLRIPERIPVFEKEFLAGIPDFVFLNPYHAVMARKAHGYIPLIRANERLTGILVTDSQGPIRNLQDLQGKTVAFPSPNAFGASLYMRALLAEKEKIHFNPVYVGTHQNVYRHILMGEAMAGGGVNATLETEPSALRSRIKVLYATPGVAPHPLAAHPRVPKADRDKVVQALLRMNQEASGRTLLERAELEGIQLADYVRDYQSLELLKLERYMALDRK